MGSGMGSGGSFRDREDAGRRLAERLEQYRDEDPIILALPRGGVPVAYEISRDLRAPLDVFIARKLGAPRRKEFGIGAVAQGGVLVLNERAVEVLEIPDEYIERAVKEETEEIERRLRLLRGDRPEPEVGGADRDPGGRRARHRRDRGGGDRGAPASGSAPPHPGRARVRPAVGRAAPPRGGRAYLPESALRPHGHQPLVRRLLPGAG